jgi:hypothetical protein
VEPISAHVWGVGIRFGWSSARFHLQDCPSYQQIAEEPVRWRLP